MRYSSPNARGRIHFSKKSPMGKKSKRRAAQKKQVQQVPKESVFKARPKVFATGCDILPRTHRLGRMMKWPKYIRVQRQEQILKKRLKVPSAIAQFSRTADKSLTKNLFNLFKKYSPPTKEERKQRLKDIAKAKANGEEFQQAKEYQIKFGLNHVTNLVQRKQAALVLIAHDVAPLEMVVWLPTLCYKMGVPFVIVKGKAALGQLVRMKTATCCCLTGVRSEDGQDLENLKQAVMSSSNEKFEENRKRIGQAEMGVKTLAKMKKRAE